MRCPRDRNPRSLPCSQLRRVLMIKWRHSASAWAMSASNGGKHRPSSQHTLPAAQAACAAQRSTGSSRTPGRATPTGLGTSRQPPTDRQPAGEGAGDRGAPQGPQKRWELYDVEADPGERTHISDRHPDVIRELEAAYDRWWEQVVPLMENEDAVGPEVNPFRRQYWNQFVGGPPGGGRGTELHVTRPRRDPPPAR